MIKYAVKRANPELELDDDNSMDNMIASPRGSITSPVSPTRGQ